MYDRTNEQREALNRSCPGLLGSFKTVGILVLMATGAGGVSSANWRGFGGPNGDFTVQVESPGGEAVSTVLWSRELGFGNSGIVARNGMLFTLYRELDANGTASESETVVAIHADDGNTVWHYTYPEPAIEGQNDYGGGRGPHATPYVTGDRLFTLGYAGSLHCLNPATGGLIWKKNLVGDFGAEPVQFGFSSSPVVIDGKLIVQASGEQGGLFALDPADGETIWKSPGVGPSYATPVLMETGNERQLVFVSQDFVQGIRLQDGEVRWQYVLPKKEMTNVPTPLLVGEGRIFIAGQGVGGAAVIQVVAKDAGLEVEELWRNTRVNFFHNSFIEQNGIVFGGSSFLYGLDVETGERVWSERGYELANVIGMGDRALLAMKDGRIVIGGLSREGVSKLHTIELFDTEAWAPPTVVGDRVYARDREAIAALSLSGEAAPSLGPAFLRAKNALIELVETGNVANVEEQLRRWKNVGNAPLSESSQLRLSQALADAGDVRGAEVLLTAIAANSPESIVALSKLGRLALIKGDRTAAHQAYSRATAIDPQFDEGKRMLGQLREGPPAGGNTVFWLDAFPDAKLVTVAGSFNSWDSFHTLLRPSDEGWTTAIDLPPGEYEYKFVVDGNWILDPKNPRKKSGNDNNVNSLLTVE